MAYWMLELLSRWLLEDLGCTVLPSGSYHQVPSLKMDFSIVPTFINTIRRLQKRDRGGDPVWRRKSGTGMKKSYGVKEISAVRKAIEKNPFMTSYQIKLC